MVIFCYRRNWEVWKFMAANGEGWMKSLFFQAIQHSTNLLVANYFADLLIMTSCYILINKGPFSRFDEFWDQVFAFPAKVGDLWILADLFLSRWEDAILIIIYFLFTCFKFSLSGGGNCHLENWSCKIFCQRWWNFLKIY